MRRLVQHLIGVLAERWYAWRAVWLTSREPERWCENRDALAARQADGPPSLAGFELLVPGDVGGLVQVPPRNTRSVQGNLEFGRRPGGDGIGDRFIMESEGGEAHCAVNNRNLANQIEFDFLDDVFSETA
ncbi:MAG TPA: hypothetical protein VF060_13670 [Trebonia sp.]